MANYCTKCKNYILMQRQHVCRPEKGRPTEDVFRGLPGAVGPAPSIRVRAAVRSNWYRQIDPVGFGFMTVFVSGAILWGWLH